MGPHDTPPHALVSVGQLLPAEIGVFVFEKCFLNCYNLHLMLIFSEYLNSFRLNSVNHFTTEEAEICGRFGLKLHIAFSPNSQHKPIMIYF